MLKESLFVKYISGSILRSHRQELFYHFTKEKMGQFFLQIILVRLGWVPPPPYGQPDR